MWGSFEQKKKNIKKMRKTNKKIAAETNVV